MVEADVFKTCNIMNESHCRELDAGKCEHGSVTMATSGGGSGDQNYLGAWHSHKIRLQKERNKVERKMTKTSEKILKMCRLKRKSKSDVKVERSMGDSLFQK
jgi:hypothetical protein